MSPLTCNEVQSVPLAEVHTAIWRCPGGPNWPAAVNPPGPAVSAVNAVSGPGEPNGTWCQVVPPSTDNSANGTNGPAVASGPAILRGYDATDLTHTLYSSDSVAADAAANAVKFQAPLVANGKVYVGGDHALAVYGLLP